MAFMQSFIAPSTARLQGPQVLEPPLSAEELQLLFFVRHGESTANESNIFAGVVDAPLTPFGASQAEEQVGYPRLTQQLNQPNRCPKLERT